MHRFVAVALSGLSLAFAAVSSAPAQEAPKPPEAKGPAFRFIGPGEGNRVAAIAGVPGDPAVYYAGAASGGLWKTVDGGAKWDPIFDDQAVSAIGAIAVAPSDPKVVYVGTGEAWAIRDIDVVGDGVYRSADAGKTWTHVGLDETGRIGRIIVDPKDPNVVYACALGNLSTPQQTRGVYKTVDGGKTWTRALFVDPNTGCSGLSLDPHDAKTLFAGMWQVEMHTWAEISGGPGSGVYVSHDAGARWTRIEGHGLPHTPVGKIDVAVAPTDSNRVYALIQTLGQGSVWRSDDGGKEWKVTSWDRTLTGRAGYYIRLAVSPGDKDKVLVSSSVFHVSTDGGKTFPGVRWGGDNHDIWMDPTNPARFAISFDGGLAITVTEGKGMQNITLPIGQMYHVAVDDQIPYMLYANMQDNSTMRLPSLPYGDGEAHRMGGCESGFTLPVPSNPDIVWASCYGNEVTRWDAKTRQARSVGPWARTLGSAPNDTPYRCHWTPPLAIDPFEPEAVYYGCQVIFKTTDQGQSWSVISPDLSTKDPSRLGSSGGLVGDNLGQFYGEVVFAIAPSPVKKGLIWAGTNDGKLWYTTAGGGQWTDVTKNIPGLPAWGTITRIEPSPFDAATAYVAVDAHLVSADPTPYIFKTTDLGKTWTKISGGLPKGPLGYVRTVTEDPNARGLLFAGTGVGLYYSLNDGADWTRFKEGLPTVPVTWTTVQARYHDLVVSTYGRGLYVLDDITPLEEQAKAAATAPVRLFAPRPTWRFARGESAFVDFDLKAAPKDKVKIEILDSAGGAVRTLESPARAGLNRVKWDLRYDDLKTVVLRTLPAENPHIWEEARFKDKTTRSVYYWGLSPHQRGPLVEPGAYQVRLTVDGVVKTAPLEVRIDPKSAGTPADLHATLALQLRIRDDLARVSDKVNLLEQMRRQIEEMADKHTADPATLKALDAKLSAVEFEMISKDLIPSDDKAYISSFKIYMGLLWLNAEVATNGGVLDASGGADHAPTDIEPKLLDGMEQKLAAAEGRFAAALAGEVAAFNRAQSAKGAPTLLTAPKAPDETEKKIRQAEMDAADDDYANPADRN